MTALVRYALGVPFIRDALVALERHASRRRDVRDDRRPARELAAARRRQDRPHARRGLVASGRSRAARRDHGLRRGSRQRHARARGTPRWRRCSPTGSTSTARVQVVDRARVYATARDGVWPARRRARRAALARAPGPDRASARRAGRRARPRSRSRWPTGSKLGRGRGLRGNRLVASSTPRRRRAAVPDAGVVGEGAVATRRTVRNLVGDVHVIVTVTLNAALDRTLTVPCSRSASATARARC